MGLVLTAVGSAAVISTQHGALQGPASVLSPWRRPIQSAIDHRFGRLAAHIRRTPSAPRVRVFRRLAVTILARAEVAEFTGGAVAGSPN